MWAWAENGCRCCRRLAFKHCTRGYCPLPAQLPGQVHAANTSSHLFIFFYLDCNQPRHAIFIQLSKILSVPNTHTHKHTQNRLNECLILIPFKPDNKLEFQLNFCYTSLTQGDISLHKFLWKLCWMLNEYHERHRLYLACLYIGITLSKVQMWSKGKQKGCPL